MGTKRLCGLLIISLIILNTLYINGGEFLPVTTEQVTLSDVEEEFWAREAIEALGAGGIISGNHDGEFKANDPITRAEFTKIIAELLQLKNEGMTNNPFIDIKSNDWCS